MRLLSRWKKQRFANRLAKAQQREFLEQDVMRRCRFERMEPRQMLNADPAIIGAVYTEQDFGSDDQGDMFEITFTGGAADTQLVSVVIDSNHDRDPSQLSRGDLYYDTEFGGRGVDNFVPFTFNETLSEGITIDDVDVSVIDGDTRLELTLRNFEAGDRLVYSIDVDEVLSLNDDPIASGAEFETSTLEARFVAPHYHDASGDGIFINAYDFSGVNITLPEDNFNGKADRTDGALLQIEQQPLPITIAGTVYHDRNMDLAQDAAAGEEGIRGVTIALEKKDETGVYIDTGLRETTDGNGNYAFGPSLNLLPGEYRLVEEQPASFPISVGAVPGTIEPGGVAPVGSAETTNVLTEIVVPLGGLHAVDYDFAEARYAEISGFVYHDRNDDGIKDAGEEGIGQVRVELFDAQGNSVDFRFTGADGSYSFQELRPGEYSLVETHPVAWFDGTDSAGTVNRFGVGDITVGTTSNDELTQITLQSEDVGVNYNFGEVLGSISGQVHRDDNGDCLLDPTEATISGVTIRLLDDAGDVVRTTTTGADGTYTFEGLEVGTYTVQEVQPDNFFQGGQVAGSAGGDASVANEISNIQVGGTNVHVVDNNFCETLGAISGYVYHDRDNDGQREPGDGEEPIQGVLIRLLDEQNEPIMDAAGNAMTARTNADGYYEFTGIAPAVYRIVEEQPATWIDGLETVGQINGTTSGVSTTNDLFQRVDMSLTSDTLTARVGENYNFGERLGSIEGFVHADPDGDCFFDQGEAPIEGVTMILTGPNGQQTTTTTDANGRYSFEDLHIGTYTVTEVQPTEFFSGGQVVGTGTGNADTPNTITGIEIGGGDVRLLDYNFCESHGSISGFVYHDRDNDGQRESGEEPISGVTMRLFDASGNAVLNTNGTPRTTQTNADGFYEFTDLGPGRYRVVEDHPNGWIDGLDTPGSHGGQADNPGDQIDTIDLTAIGQNQAAIHATDYNFGERLGSISGFVHFDPDEDCEFDQGEDPISGVIITLTDQDGNTRTTVTDADGLYEFNDLFAGTYTVTETQPIDYFSGGQRVGSGSGNASQGNVISGIQLGGSDIQLTDYNFCETLGSISGFVYHDRDNDGNRDTADGEEAISNVTIRLHDITGAPVVDSTGQPRTAVTNADGYYEFTDLAPGTYRVVEDHPIDWIDGLDTAGTVDGNSVGVAGNDTIDAIALSTATGGAADGVNYNFGERLGSIEGFVHADPDGDCLLDSGEQRIEGVQITLIDQNGNTQTTTTDSNGLYRFEGLTAGSYTIVESQPTDFFTSGQRVGQRPNGLQGPGDASVANRISDVTISSTTSDLRDYNFCEHLGSISGFVYHDRDNDGQREPGNQEDAISGVTLTLEDSQGQAIGTTTTNADGFYEFTALSPGVYRVVESHPAGWIDGLDTPGTIDGNSVGIANNPGDSIGFIDLSAFSPTAAAKNGVDYNFGELQPSSISGVVHADNDRDCFVDPGEERLAGVEIQLLDGSGNVIDTTFTNNNGEYNFDNLLPGEYSVREIQPTDYFHFNQVAGSNGGNDNTRDVISAIEIGSGETLVDYNFCELPPVSISGYVFQDGPTLQTETGLPPEDLTGIRDGLQTPDDTPLEGVVLQLQFGLVSADPVPTSEALPGIYTGQFIETTTDANGYYEFTGLRPDAYHVFEVQPEGYFDGLDTGGTLGGQAVNLQPSDTPPPLSQQALINIAGAGNSDAIVRIALNPGQNSILNNFSELTAEPPSDPPPEPPEPPQEPPREFPELDPLPDPAQIPVFFAPTVQPEFYWTPGGFHDFTWHLSIIDAGAPRGREEFVSLGESELTFTTYLEQTNWSPAKLAGARWTLHTAFGNVDAQRTDGEQHLFGVPNGIPIVGDFNGDGIDEIAIYVDGEWFIDLDGDGVWDSADLWAKLGTDEDQPVVGDWDGDGKDDIGIYGPAWPGDDRAIRAEPGLPDPENNPVERPKNIPPTAEEATDGYRYMKHTQDGSTRADLIDHVFHYGSGESVPVAGDWNGDGISSIGIFKDGKWLLDTNGDGRHSVADETARFGDIGDIPIVGDFNHDGVDEIGVYRNGKWIIDSNGNKEFDARDKVFELGGAEDRPVVGDWNGDGKVEPGLFRGLDSTEDRQAENEGDTETR